MKFSCDAVGIRGHPRLEPRPDRGANRLAIDHDRGDSVAASAILYIIQAHHEY